MTEHEILNGIFGQPDPEKRCGVFIRELENYIDSIGLNNQNNLDKIKLAKRYFELDNKGTLDSNTNQMLDDLKSRIVSKLPQDKIFKFKIDWKNVEMNQSVKNSENYLDEFGEKFYK